MTQTRVAVVLLLALCLAGAVEAQTYNVADLGTLGGTLSWATGINAFGQVVGYSCTTDDAAGHAFLWTKSEGMKDLGTLGGASDVSCPAFVAAAFGINDFRRAVGYSAPDCCSDHAVLWTKPKHLKDLGTLGGTNSRAEAVNDFGQAVGGSGSPDGDHAFLWTESEGMKDLGTLGGGASQAFGINVFGRVVGSSSTTDQETHAFLWSKRKGMQDLETLGGELSVAFGVNDQGQVVGESVTADDAIHAFLWSQKEDMQDLGALGSGDLSFASGINDFGQVVGSYYPLPQNPTPLPGDISTQTHAFIWTESKGMRDLNDLVPDIQVGCLRLPRP